MCYCEVSEKKGSRCDLHHGQRASAHSSAGVLTEAGSGRACSCCKSHRSVLFEVGEELSDCIHLSRNLRPQSDVGIC